MTTENNNVMVIQKDPQMHNMLHSLSFNYHLFMKRSTALQNQNTDPTVTTKFIPIEMSKTSHYVGAKPNGR